MGGRGSRFRDVNPTDREQKKDYYTDFGDADKENISDDFVSNKDLTKSLKNSNILVCESLKKLDSKINNSNLKQINNLTNKFSKITSDNLEDEPIKIRSYKMNRVSYKTGNKTPEYSVLALFYNGKKQICINERTIKDKENLTNLIKQSQKDNYSVKTDKGKESLHVITHEYGHFIEQCLIEKQLQNDLKEWTTYRTGTIEQRMELEKREANKIRTEIKNIATKDYKATESQLITSKYGETDKNPFEWFAEVFAESQLHKTNKPLILAMKDYLKEENKK